MEKIIINVLTNEQSIVPLTEEEITQAQADTEISNQQKTQEQAQTTAKASALAKLTALGLSEDEVKALIG